MFQPTYRYFRKIGNTDQVSAWEPIKSPATSDNNLALPLNYIDFIPRTKFGGQCLKQDKVIFTHKRVSNINIVCEINLWPFKESSDFTLVNFLVGTVNLSKNGDFKKHKYSGYGFGIQARESFSLSDGSGFGKNVIIFVAHMISSGHVDSKKEKS